MNPSEHEALGRRATAAVVHTLLDAAEWQDKQAVAAELEALVRGNGYPRAVVYPFGSCVSGLGEQDSDLDLACDVHGTGDIDPPTGEAKVVFNVGRVLRRRPFGGLEVIGRARVPIVKNEPPRKDTTQRLRGKQLLYGTKFDLSMRMNGVYNSRLLRAYFVDPALRVAAVQLKRWGKAVGLINPRFGMPSSYAVTLMLIHSAVRNGTTPLVPVEDYADIDVQQPLQDLPPPPPPDSDAAAGFHERVGQLLAGFVEYYTNTFDYETDVVNVRSPTAVTKHDLGWDAAEGHPNVRHLHLAVEDPFEFRGAHRPRGGPNGRNITGGLLARELGAVQRLLHVIGHRHLGHPPPAHGDVVGGRGRGGKKAKTNQHKATPGRGRGGRGGGADKPVMAPASKPTLEAIEKELAARGLEGRGRGRGAAQGRGGRGRGYGAA